MDFTSDFTSPKILLASVSSRSFRSQSCLVCPSDLGAFTPRPFHASPRKPVISHKQSASGAVFLAKCRGSLIKIAFTLYLALFQPTPQPTVTKQTCKGNGRYLVAALAVFPNLTTTNENVLNSSSASSYGVR